MENQRECYEALLAGKTIKDVGTCFIKLNDDGDLILASGKPACISFGYPENWQIYKEPKTLCRVGSHTGKERIRLLLNYDAETKKGNTESGVMWAEAEPLTKQEIQVFMDNAPEKL